MTQKNGGNSSQTLSEGAYQRELAKTNSVSIRFGPPLWYGVTVLLPQMTE
jgi:hypothetical protein